jgi:hypothetical protein
MTSHPLYVVYDPVCAYSQLGYFTVVYTSCPELKIVVLYFNGAWRRLDSFELPVHI